MMLTRQTWIEALRGGKYQQDRVYLRTNTGYCCLGVACDLYDHESWRLRQSPWKNYYVFEYGNNDVCYSSALPHQIREKLNLTSSNHDELIIMNDRGDTFEQIASYIEALP